MNLERHFPIKKNGTIFTHIFLLLILFFGSIGHAMADEDPEEMANPPNPVQFVGSISDYGLDMDEDGLYDYLVVKFNAKSNVPSDYFFTGDLSVDLGLHESKGSIAHEFRMLNLAKNSTYLNEKDHTVILNFEGGRIHENELEGPYEVEISVSNGSWGFGRGIEYTTEAYEHAKFEQPESLLSGPVRSQARALELAKQNAAETGIDLGDLKEIDITPESNGEIWIFNFEKNEIQECFAVEGNSVEDVRHWTLNETASKTASKTPLNVPFLHVGCTIILLAGAGLLLRE